MNKIKEVDFINKCDFCEELAVYDAPTNGGAWAYMCNKCSKVHSSNKKLTLGYKAKGLPK